MKYVLTENHPIITIHYDFKDGTELPYVQFKQSRNDNISFTTNCLEFFSCDNLGAKVVRKDGSLMMVIDLLNNKRGYIDKEIRFAHNLHKMLIANAFNW